MINKINRSRILKMNVFYIILSILLISGVSCKEYTPVLLWSSQPMSDFFPPISALDRLSSTKFNEYVHKRILNDKPIILVFVEENLSVEDFSWRDVDANGAFPMLSNLTTIAHDKAFLPSVYQPYKALKKLQQNGYLWANYEKNNFNHLKCDTQTVFEIKLSEPDFLEDRPDMLKKHDEEISQIYNEVVDNCHNVLAIYTGHHNSWFDASLGRYKREDREEDSADTLIIKDKESVVLLATSLPIIYKDEEEMNITKINGEPTINKNEDKVILHVKFHLNSVKLDFLEVNFEFSGNGKEWWTLDNISTTKKKVLKPTTPVGAPAGYSYFCNPTVEFREGNVSLIFENFQAEPRVSNGSFGPVLHCIPFFSIAIWSGIMIVVILSIVLAWGIVMIMDINTNDRFDDPKGKTITITAVD